jgi:hypothetical protein
MQTFAQTAAGGAIVALLILGAGQPMTVRPDGLQFPDGTIQTTAARADTRKAFYITESLHLGSTALSACEEGYHMASLWEILDVSNLRYAIEVSDAKTQEDAGHGPPSGDGGWVRTGWFSSPGQTLGQSNCELWTSTLNTRFGMVVKLQETWDGSNPPEVEWLGPWNPAEQNCSAPTRVWCFED